MNNINLIEKNLIWATIQNIHVGAYSFWIIFNWNMSLAIYSKFKITWNKKDDLSDLIWLKILSYVEEKKYYVIWLGKNISIKIWVKDGDFDYEILQLILQDGTIIVDRWED